MIVASLAGCATAVAAPVVAAFAAPASHRQWLWRVAALLLLYVIVLVLAGMSQAAAPWAGVIAAGAVLVAVQPFIALGVLARDEIGLRAPRPGSAGPAMIATILALVYNAAVLELRGAAPVDVSMPVVLAALLAAPLEELVFRGALLALADRALPPRWQIAGAQIGPGGIAITVAFIALHGLSLGMLAGIGAAALLYLWLRARTGSLVAPILAHLAWNLVVLLMH
jgi:membrane protease YdiL (CAAX protease family)